MACLMFVLSIAAVQAESQIKIEQGTLGASKIMVAVPNKWNKNVLILVHGMRGENSPLTAEFDTTELYAKQLLSEGWIVASTSFRRNGHIIDEAIQDIDELREHIIKTYGKPNHVYLLGGSMGGRIVTHIAETRADKYDGAVAVGAALSIESASYTFDPKMPILFLTNQSETSDVKAYISKAARSTVKPAFWLVKRDGHCATTEKEDISAFRALVAYRNTGKIEFEKDGTIVPKPPSSVARLKDGMAFAKVKHDHSYVNLQTEFVADDLEKLGIKKHGKFQVSFGEKSFIVLYGTTYNDVPQGEWIAFINADGYLKIARNYESSAKALGCKENDTICIRPVEHEGKTP